MENNQLNIFESNNSFDEKFEQLKKDLSEADSNAIQDMLLLSKTKMMLMKKRGIHDVLSGRIDKLVKQHENIKLNFLNSIQ